MGKKWKQWQIFICSGSKISRDSDCSHEIKRCLLLGRKAMTNLDSVLESRNITLLTKVRTDKAMVFPVVMHRCERWIIKKVEQNRIDAFELESPLYCKEIKSIHPKGNQPWIFIGMTDVEAPILATWCKELTHGKRPWCWERQKEKEVAENEMVR